MKLSEKLIELGRVNSSESTKDTIKSLVRALENFSSDELRRTIGSDNILSIIQTYSADEIKSMIEKNMEIKEMSVGDKVICSDKTKAVVLEVNGVFKDRVTILYSNDGYLRIRESVSAYDLEVVGNIVNVSDIIDYIR